MIAAAIRKHATTVNKKPRTLMIRGQNRNRLGDAVLLARLGR